MLTVTVCQLPNRPESLEKAWAALVPMLRPNGIIDYIQQVGAAPAAISGDFFNKDYGYGAFLLAGTEMMKYYGTY